jgi:tetratricopeptide (TPR) repeat protein
VPRLAGTYSTVDLARLLGVPASRVRAWAKAVLEPPAGDARRARRFTFPDLVVLRAARDLAAAGVPARRIHAALAGLRERLPAGRSLASVRIAAEGQRVVVRGPGESWEPESGQVRLDFAVADLAAQAAPLAAGAAAAALARGAELSADDWFALALDLEATSPAEAVAAYARVLELAPAHADAHLNLGRLHHERGDLAGAERHYRAALAARAEDATAAFNLGVALQDAQRWSEAIGAYRQALELDAAYADAYYNLAAVYEHLGDKAQAIQQLKSYRALTRG